jgi:hypothetical protein
MENNFFRRIPTDLDLNGPVLSYTLQPSDASGDKDDSVTFTVAAEALFPGDPDAENGGTITYQWYEVNGGALSEGSKFTGVTTPTLTVLSLVTPTDQGRQFYCEIDYIPNNEYDTAASGTGPSLNGPLASESATVSVNPELEIIAQPVNRVVGEDVTASFNINAGLTDDTYLDDGAVEYQWYVNDTAVTEGSTIQLENGSFEIIEEVFINNRDESFNSDSSVVLPATSYDITGTIAAAKGGGGGNDAGGTGGSGGNGRAANFTLTNANAGNTLDFKIGRSGGGGGTGNQQVGGPAGSSSLAAGGKGGGAGQNGWSGGGGGGGGASGVVRGDGTQLVVAGGGGGGGGASLSTGQAPSGGTGGSMTASTSSFSASTGGGGTTKQGDGGGGGAGGGGVPGGGGGGSGQDNSSNGGGGGGGGSRYRSDLSSITSEFTNNGDGYANIAYKFTTTTETIVDTLEYQNTTFTGTTSDTLNIVSDNANFASVKSVYCVVSHPTATNSPITSDTVYFTLVDTAAQNNIVIETVSNVNDATISQQNLSSSDVTLQDQDVGDTESGRVTTAYVLYSPDKDINVEMDLYGGKGDDNGGFTGGEGGFSRIRFTMEQNVEYVITGLSPLVNSPFLYRKGALIANVGGGGDAGTSGKGGFGGGIGVSGAKGLGRNAGAGGQRIADGALTTDGIFGSATTLTAVAPDTKATAPNAGRTIKCTKGVYWKDQGVSPCSDVGTTKFRLSDGTVVDATASIERGFKAGYNINRTGGDGIANGGDGGNGTTGGVGGQNGSGGGGASGYTDGSVTVVDTQLGGSTENAKIVLRLAS